MPVARPVIDAQLRELAYFGEFFTRREVNHLPEVIREGEVVRALISGVYESTMWLVVATDQRVVFLDKGMLYGLKQLELPLDKIQGITHESGLVFAELSITTGGATWKVEQLSKKAAKRFADIVSQQIQAAKAPGGPREDFVSRLERLGKLRDSGVLSEAEFNAQKQRILDGG